MINPLICSTLAQKTHPEDQKKHSFRVYFTVAKYAINDIFNEKKFTCLLG
jgi:hypothetical protein